MLRIMASLRCFNRLQKGQFFARNTNKCATEVTVHMVHTTTSPASVVVDGLSGRLLSAPPVLRGLSDSALLSRGSGTGPLWNFTCPLNRSAMHIERCLHTSTYLMGTKWEKYNRKVYPPQKPGEPPRMAEVYYSRRQIKHSMRRMWYTATFVKGMMIDEALTQLQFVKRKSAQIAREVLLEAQEEAVKNHNVEFKSNLHIAESFVTKGEYDHAMRIHAKGRFSILDLVYCNYFVCLKEGPPPKKVEATGYDQAQHYIDSLRKRTVTHSL